MRKIAQIASVATVAVVVLSAAVSPSAADRAATSTKRTASVKVSTKKLPKLGVVLVNSKGRTLYMFVPDKHKKVTCVNACAAIWPPLKLTNGAKAVASGQAKSSLLGSDSDPSGGHVVTYAHWPLYTYVADSKAGVAKGQGLKLNGGLWYVLSPSGKVIKTKP